MVRLDMDLIRHALQTASDRGFSEVELELGDDRFQATFEPRKVEPRRKLAGGPDEAITKTVSAPSVGYFRLGKIPLIIGQRFDTGDVVGDIVALGLKNEVISKWSGKVVQVMVTAEQPVEYGQPLVVLELEN